MKRWHESVWVRQWQQLPAGRRTSLNVALWGLAFIAAWQLAWLPAQARLQQAEQKLLRAQALGAQLQRVSRAPVRSQGSVERLTPASLSESARVAGLSITALETRAEQVDISLQGTPAAVFSWLHSLGRDTGGVRNIQLHVDGEWLQARFALALSEA